MQLKRDLIFLFCETKKSDPLYKVLSKDIIESEIVSHMPKANVDERNPKHIKKMTRQLFGKLFADKGYLSKALWEMLFRDGVQLFTKLRKNMKNHIMTMEDKILLRKRAIIETINDLKKVNDGQLFLNSA